VPLGERRLKSSERSLLGETIEGNRYRLMLDGEPASLNVHKLCYPVTVLIL
jgi:hypothetical protein